MGIPNGAMQVARFGGPGEITLKSVCALIDVEHPERRPQSLRAAIRALQNLPAITLEANLVSGTTGEEPYELVINLSSGDGIIWHTTVLYKVNDKVLDSDELGSAGGSLHPTQLGPGVWDIAVERAGIGSTGMTVLTKFLGRVEVRKRQVPEPPKPPPPQPVPPEIAVKSKGDGSFVVSGKRFVGNAVVNIHVVRTDHPLDPGARALLTATALASGELAEFPTGNLCAQLPPGDRLSFSANDGRLDQSNHDLTSNTVTISCPLR